MSDGGPYEPKSYGIGFTLGLKTAAAAVEAQALDDVIKRLQEAALNSLNEQLWHAVNECPGCVWCERKQRGPHPDLIYDYDYDTGDTTLDVEALEGLVMGVKRE